ncbi:unnamed protein product, partial [Adineta steineri]
FADVTVLTVIFVDIKHPAIEIGYYPSCLFAGFVLNMEPKSIEIERLKKEKAATNIL